MISQEDVIRATGIVWIGSRQVGSAVAIFGQYLLTAEHVVAQRQGSPGMLSVSFPGSGTPGVPVEALQLDSTWSELDIAVLKMTDNRYRANSVTPLTIWPSRRLPSKVRLFGYPVAESAPRGVWRQFTTGGLATNRTRQLVWSEGVGSQVGHSGGPVVDSDTLALVGLLLQHSGPGHFDRFLPVSEMRLEALGMDFPWIFQGERAREHFEGRSTGSVGRVHGGDRFFGRRRALQDIKRHLVGRPDVPLVIVGQPGAGKSSVLGRAARRLKLPHIGAGLIFHARNATVRDLMVALYFVIDGPNDTQSGPGDLVNYARANTKRPILILVDALDEARSGSERAEMASILMDLARIPWIAVVVATRPLSSTSSSYAGELMRRFGIERATAHNLLDLDSPRYADPVAVRLFAAAVLKQSGVQRPGPVSGAWRTYRAEPERAERLAELISRRADRNFLVAALTASSLGVSDEVMDPASRAMASMLPSSVGEALDKYLLYLPATGHALTLGLMVALAYARGEGLSDDMWLRFANCLGYEAKHATLDGLSHTAIIDFLVVATDQNGVRVRRLFHQALVDQLLATRDQVLDEQRIAAALRTAAAESGSWGTETTYGLIYAAQHSSRGNVLGDLLEDTDFVGHCDSGSVLSTIRSARSAVQGDDTVRVMRLVMPTLSADLGERMSQVTLAALHLGNVALAAKYHEAIGTQSPLLPFWAQSLGSSHDRVMARGRVEHLAVGRLGNRDVIAAGSVETDENWDRHCWIELWDEFGRPVVDAIRLDEDLNAPRVAVGMLGSQPMVTALRDNGLILLDESGQPIASDVFQGLMDTTADAMAFCEIDSQSVLLLAADSGIRIWGSDELDARIGGEALGGRILVDAVRGDRHGVVRVCCVERYPNQVELWNFDGSGRQTSHDRVEVYSLSAGPEAAALLKMPQPLLALSVRNGEGEGERPGWAEDETRLWLVRMADGHLVSESIGVSTWVPDIAAGMFAGSPQVIAPLQHDVALWDGKPRSKFRRLGGHTGHVSAVAIGSLGGREVLVSGGDDQAVRIWDAISVDQVAHTEHEAPIARLSTIRNRGAEYIVAGSADGIVSLWDLHGRRHGPNIRCENGYLSCLGVGTLRGTPVIVAGGERSIYVWDVKGRLLGSLRAPHETVANVGVGRLGSKEVVFATSDYGYARFWDSRLRIIDTHYHEDHTITDLKLARVAGRHAIVSNRSIEFWTSLKSFTSGRSTRTGLRGDLVSVGVVDGHTVLGVVDAVNDIRVWSEANDGGRSIAFGRPISNLMFMSLRKTSCVAVTSDHELVILRLDGSVAYRIGMLEAVTSIVETSSGVAVAYGRAITLLRFAGQDVTAKR